LRLYSNHKSLHVFVELGNARVALRHLVQVALALLADFALREDAVVVLLQLD